MNGVSFTVSLEYVLGRSVKLGLTGLLYYSSLQQNSCAPKHA